MNAIVVIGLLLLANMSLTVREQLTFLVIFSIASLFLLVRFHTLDEQADWLRRRIGDPSAISALYLRGGTVFIIAAISGSLVLTNAASSAPLAGAWTDVGARVVEWGQFLERFLPVSRSGRSLGPTFGDTSVIQPVWSTSDQVQLRVEFPTTEQYRAVPRRRRTTTTSCSLAGSGPARSSRSRPRAATPRRHGRRGPPGRPAALVATIRRPSGVARCSCRGHPAPSARTAGSRTHRHDGLPRRHRTRHEPTRRTR